jgi:RHS repeat-associated protein
MEADAFGTPPSHDGNAGGSARYTGKPYDEDLGAYVFPFRNYRPQEGRWMSADPSGFPNGLNAAIYTTNPVAEIDPWGLDVIVITAPNAVFGLGHIAVVIGSGNDWTYYSWSRGEDHSTSTDNMETNDGITSSDASGIMDEINAGRDGSPYTNYAWWYTDADMDAAAKAAGDGFSGDYSLFFNNWLTMIKNLLAAAGITTENRITPNGWLKANAPNANESNIEPREPRSRPWGKRHKKE